MYLSAQLQTIMGKATEIKGNVCVELTNFGLVSQLSCWRSLRAISMQGEEGLSAESQ